MQKEWTMVFYTAECKVMYIRFCLEGINNLVASCSLSIYGTSSIKTVPKKGGECPSTCLIIGQHNNCDTHPYIGTVSIVRIKHIRWEGGGVNFLYSVETL